MIYYKNLGIFLILQILPFSKIPWNQCFEIKAPRQLPFLNKHRLFCPHVMCITYRKVLLWSFHHCSLFVLFVFHKVALGLFWADMASSPVNYVLMAQSGLQNCQKILHIFINSFSALHIFCKIDKIYARRQNWMIISENYSYKYSIITQFNNCTNTVCFEWKTFEFQLLFSIAQLLKSKLNNHKKAGEATTIILNGKLMVLFPLTFHDFKSGELTTIILKGQIYILN